MIDITARRQPITMEWSAEVIQSRVADTTRRERYPAGSPDTQEAALYRQLVLQVASRQTACCLGMTPELRSVLVQCYQNLVSVDCSKAAISIYSDWLTMPERSRETIIADNWSDYLNSLPPQSIDCIAGDGILANLAGEAEAQKLILSIYRVLRPSGLFVTRSPVMPADPPDWRELRDAYRSGLIDEASFGLGTRFLGHRSGCYSPVDGLLDNSKVFDNCSQLNQAGELTDAELAIVNRYLFRELNWIPSEDNWRTFLSSIPFKSIPHQLEGKHWYQYCRVYELAPQ